MKIRFKHIDIEGFLSIGDASIDLDREGYILINGINNNPLDNAKSNGSGKCFGAGTKIRMWDGSIKNVEDIEVYDIIMGDDSTPRMVLETHSGEAELFKVHLDKSGNYDYICNGEHTLCLNKTLSYEYLLNNNKVYRKYTGDDYIELSVNDYIKSPNSIKRAYCHKINPCNNFYHCNDDLLIDPYFLGMWLGSKVNDRISIVTTDDELKNYFVDYTEKYNFNYNTSKRRNSDVLVYNVVSTTPSNELINNFNHYKLFNNKHIPADYLKSTIESRLQLLAGLIDAAGYLSKQKKYVKKQGSYNYYYSYTFSFKDVQLAEDVINLCQSLGFKVTFHNKRYFNISVQGNIESIPTLVERKQITNKLHYYDIDKTFLHQTVSSIGIGKYYGFQVTGNGKFLLANGVVVHNSSIINAICWTLTGETINGLTSNIPNIHTNTGCKCSLTFDVNGVEYKITRSREHVYDGTNLTIFVDGKDKSGKGIRDSQALLSEYLPDITSQFLGSVILLGQGLPHKFTSNEPSKRKELLENLSKSDFMIEDIKNRIENRLNDIKNKLKLNEDKQLQLNTTLTILNRQGDSIKEQIEGLNNHEDYSIKISSLEEDLKKLNQDRDNNSNELNTFEKRLSSLNDELLSINSKEFSDIKIVEDVYLTTKMERLSNINSYTTELNSIKKEINKINLLPDICPTCGQKIVNKPNTEGLNERRMLLEDIIKDENSKFNEEKQKYETEKNSIHSKHSSQKQSITEEINTLKNNIKKSKSLLDTIVKNILTNEKELLKVKNDRDNLESLIVKYNKDLADTVKEIDSNKEELIKVNEIIDDTNKHLTIIKKFDTIVKRDFRGFLLSNVIKFMDTKAKEYCQVMFNHDNLSIKTVGTNIDISFCNKSYENLSGGEKQKIDIITQFTIRDMLCQYLNFRCNVLFIDEVFDYLDAQGTSEVLNLISKKLTDIEAIYIISHHNDLELSYDDEIQVIKDENGVSSINN